jgi:tetratricopeptide (TPR) repeat protein/serine/threonine protein kinase
MRVMTHPRPSKQEIFNAAAELGHAERAAFLDRACGGDAALRAEIEELLRHDVDAGSFLGCPAPTASEPPLESVGSTIGPYKLLEQIGEGGFGVVFMAEQTAPVRRRVALKVIKPGMDTRQVIGRFEAERQALALMDHPNIAKVLDAGTTGTGRPYFVMELVRGIPITEYCDAQRLNPRQRLELFVTVCHAVQHAHQKGIIHRDIKPSNVLVTLHDDMPVAKVIDFGIAKATTGQLTDMTVFTAFAQMIGTPLYMSPEQASLTALDVDTRSDIYSLGVLLYELLTGTTPFDRSRLKDAAFDEIRRIVREEEPATPSTRLSTSDALPSVAANRGTEPAKLTRVVRGELDWIVMKSLEKDRTRRYETANGFAMDVQRYLADETVSACPPSAGYRLRKLVRRNRRALAVAALLCGMLVVAAGSLGWMARDRATRRVRTAEAVAGLLDRCEDALRGEQTDQAALVLETAERRAAEGGAVALEGRVARCRADLALLRELDAIDAYYWAGHTTPRRGLAGRWRAALADYGITPHEGSARDGAALVDRSMVRERLLTALDLWLVTESSAGVLELLRAVDPDPYRDVVRDAVCARDVPALVALAARPEALTQPGRFMVLLPEFSQVPAERWRAAVATALRARPGDLRLLMTLGASYLQFQGLEVGMVPGLSAAGGERGAETAEAMRWFQAAVAAHPTNVAAHVNLGNALKDRGDLHGAIACYEEAIRLGPDFAPGHSNLGAVYQAMGDPNRAIAYLEKAVRIEPTFAPGHCNLGVALQAKGDLERAIACYEDAVRLDPTFAAGHCNLGAVLLAKGDPHRAFVHCKEAIRLDPTYALAHSNLGIVLRENGDPDGAIASYREAIRLDPNRAANHCNLGIVLNEKGDPDGAIACYREAIRLAPTFALALVNLGNLLREKEGLDGAIACYEEAIRADPVHGLGHFNLGNAWREKGELDKAVAAYSKAIAVMPDHAASYCALGLALADLGRFAEALESFRKGHDLGCQRPGWSYPSEDWVRAAERLVALETRLPDVLAGQAADPDDQVAMADLCLRYKGRSVDAVLLYRQAFAAKPSLADRLDADRYNAARAAALAGCGRGVGAEALDAGERARLRGLALAWLRAEFAALDFLARDAAGAAQSHTCLGYWLQATDLSGIRDAEGLAELPDAERESWTKLWNDVRDLRARTEEK